MSEEQIKKYPKTKMFRIKETIGVPHPYCITPKHVTVAANCFGGMLDKYAIIQAEKQGAKCGICKGKLSYEEHKQALLVEVNDKKKRDLKDIPELKKYLLSIKDQAEKDGFEGFAFIQASDNNNKKGIK